MGIFFSNRTFLLVIHYLGIPHHDPDRALFPVLPNPIPHPCKVLSLQKKKKLPNLCSPYAHWVFSSPRRFPNRTENYPVLPNNQIPNSAICWAQSLGWKKESHQVWLLSHHLPCNVLGRVSKRDVELESKPHLLTHLRQHRGPASPQG